MTTLTAALIDGMVILALALAAVALLRRRSAACRHALLVSAIAAAAAMPALELVVPHVPLTQPVIVAASPTPAAPRSTVPAFVNGASIAAQPAASAETSWREIALAVWIAGAAVMIAGLAVALVRLARLRARAVPADERWRHAARTLMRENRTRPDVAVLQSDSPALLVTYGTRRPVILLPSCAASWPMDRIHSVLRHELAHVQRRDALVQTSALFCRALLWINPLIWIACHRLRLESELAADDAVLRAGVKADAYAADLFAVAAQLSAPAGTWVSVPAIAQPSTLERRIAAMLYRHTNRAPVGRLGWIAAAVAAVAIAAPLASVGVGARALVLPLAEPLEGPRAIEMPAVPALTPPPAAAPAPATSPAPLAEPSHAQASIAGRVVDQMGWVIPGANVTAVEMASGKRHTTWSTSEGTFALGGLPAGRYELTVRLAGFSTSAEAVTLESGATLERVVAMPLGAVSESVTVSCRSAWADALVRLRGLFVATLSAQEPSGRVRVGGAVRQPLKVRDAKPTCPATPSAPTTIRISGHIDTAGVLQDLVIQPSTNATAIDTDFAEAALAALRQWRYQPAELNGQKAVVMITIAVTFTAF